MDEFMKECFLDAFSKTNIDKIWENKTSKTDILPIETDLPIRNKLNDIGTRNIEIMLQSPFGLMYKTLGLVENDQIIIPNEFSSLKSQVNFGNFKTFNFKREIDIMIGAFSLDSLFWSFSNKQFSSMVRKISTSKINGNNDNGTINYGSNTIRTIKNFNLYGVTRLHFF